MTSLTGRVPVRGEVGVSADLESHLVIASTLAWLPARRGGNLSEFRSNLHGSVVVVRSSVVCEGCFVCACECRVWEFGGSLSSWFNDIICQLYKNYNLYMLVTMLISMLVTMLVRLFALLMRT